MAAGLLVFCARDEGDPLGVEVSPSARAADVLEQAAARDPHLEGAELHFQGRRVGRDELLSDAGISAEATVQLVPSCFRRLPEELRRGLAEQEVELPTATIRALLTPPAADAASAGLQCTATPSRCSTASIGAPPRTACRHSCWAPRESGSTASLFC
eukprot:TRINITY_DN26155_c0_g1_i4.p2 TRINITY_DN26155_c0_g1~~TRINITY_DN26155_c0_g1_i4.p2  ORF type:complete len:157 (+),score=18.72 TRINITY_DN26155_c0_g1_i4:81-551(+)